MRNSYSWSALLGIALALGGCSPAPEGRASFYQFADEEAQFDPFDEEDFGEPVGEPEPQPPVGEPEPEPQPPFGEPEPEPEPEPQPPFGEPEPQPPFGEPDPQPPFGDPEPQPPFGEPDPQPPVGDPEPQPPVGDPEPQPPFGEPEAQPQPPDTNSRVDADAAYDGVLADARCPRGAPDFDTDGLCDTLEPTYGTDPKNPDTDGDSLSDGMEVLGYRFQSKTVKLANANPLRKDIYLEIDYMPNYRPCNSAVEDVRAAFAAAPVMNADGSFGITLHAEIDDAQKNKDTDTNINTRTRLPTLKRKYFNVERTPAYHWALFAHQYDSSGSSGVSLGAPHTDFMVTLGTFPVKGGTRAEQAGTLMHELGHNLGLEHGGPRLRGTAVDQTLFKPNYLSVMNYNYQFWGVPIGGVLKLDYSSVAVPQLSERNLFEGLGLSDERGSNATVLASYGAPIICLQQFVDTNTGSARCDKWPDSAYALGASASSGVDWNLNGEIDSKPLAVDINGTNGAEDIFQATEADWHNLEYDGGNVIGNFVRSVRRNVEGDAELEPVAPVQPVLCQSAPPPSPFVTRIVGESAAACQ